MGPITTKDYMEPLRPFWKSNPDLRLTPQREKRRRQGLGPKGLELHVMPQTPDMGVSDKMESHVGVLV